MRARRGHKELESDEVWVKPGRVAVQQPQFYSGQAATRFDGVEETSIWSRRIVVRMWIPFLRFATRRDIRLAFAL